MVVAVVMMGLGLFGIVATAKYYERFRMSMTRVGRLREQLDRIHPDLKLDETEKAADEKHSSRYPYLSIVRLHLLWRLMMGSIFALDGRLVNVIRLRRLQLFDGVPRLFQELHLSEIRA